jgi:hypothetical protein
MPKRWSGSGAKLLSLIGNALPSLRKSVMDEILAILTLHSRYVCSEDDLCRIHCHRNSDFMLLLVPFLLVPFGVCEV